MRNINDNLNPITSQVDKKIFILGVKRSTRQQKSYMNHLVDRHNNYDNIFESHGSMAKKTGIPKNSIQRLSTTVSQKGFIKKKSRGRIGLKKNTCQYILPEIWDDPDIRKELTPYIPALQIKKRYSSFQSVKNSKYLSWKIIQLASVGYIKVSPSIIFKNKEEGIGNRHISNDTLYVREKIHSFKLAKKEKLMTEFIKNLGGFNETAKEYLSAYRDEIVKESIKGLGNRQLTGDAWSYFLKILARVSRTKNVEPNYSVINSITGKCVLILPITGSSIIASSPKPFFGKKEVHQEISKAPVYIDSQAVPEITLDQLEKERLHKKYKATRACMFEAMTKYEKYHDPIDRRWVDDYKRILDTMHSKYPYLFGNEVPSDKPVNTAVHVANEIAKIINHPIGNNMEGYRNRVIRVWTETPYLRTGEEHEGIAIQYIEARRKQFAEPIATSPQSHKPAPIGTQKLADLLRASGFLGESIPEIKRESITPNEEDYDEVLD